MPITAENIVRHEIIGLKVRIAKSTDTSQKGLTGRVMDESYNTFVIETKNGEKTVAKKNAFLYSHCQIRLKSRLTERF